jgi:O-antigen/teichoic acid export membrane protein
MPVNKVDPGSPLRAAIMRAARYSGFNWGVIYGSSARIWSMLTGAITLLLIARYFSPSVQGFYYTFISLTAVQVFFELGLTQVVIQFAAHEWACLAFGPTGHVEGDPIALSRLSSLARFVNNWFGKASILFFIGILAAGWFAFYDAKVQIAWQWPWAALCLVVAVDLWTLPLWSLLEGCNQIKSVYGLRFIRAVIGSAIAWPMIAMGAGLWSLPISTGVSLAVVTVMLFRRHGRFFESVLRNKPSQDHVISWRQEVWPMQWRIAVSWLSGYFCFYLFVPVLFKFYGPIPAGQMGMTFNVITSMSSIAGMFVQTKVPSFGILIAQRKWAELDSLALRVGVSSVLITLLGSIALFLIVLWLNLSGYALAHRILSPGTLFLFLATTVIMQATMPMSTYLRAHRREPLMWISLASGLLVGGAVILSGMYWGATGMGWSYLLVTLLFTLPTVSWKFIQCRTEWHA